MAQNPAQPLRTALIGASGYGRFHYNLIREMVAQGKMSLDAIVIINPMEIPEVVEECLRGGCAIYASVEAMLAAFRGRLDLVCIPTGIGTHAPFTLAALESGANVLVEKPLAGTMAEVEAMEAASLRTGRRIFVGFQDIYRTDLHQIKKDLLQGVYGQLEEIRILGLWPRPQSYYTRNNWAGRIKSEKSFIYDSPANNALAHYLNLGLFLAGDQAEESASVREIKAELYRANEIESFDTICAQISMGNGVKLHYAVSHAIEEVTDPVVRIITKRYQLVLGCRANVLLTLQGELLHELPFHGTEGGRSDMLGNIAKVLRGEASLVCKLGVAKAHTQTIVSLHQDNAIKTVAPDKIQIVQTESGPLVCVRGLSEKLQAAHREGRLEIGPL